MNGTSSTNIPGEVQDVKSNVLMGTIGALIGALLGAAIWVGINQFGIIASIAGIAIIFFACKGYEMLSKRMHLKGVIISVLISLIVLTLAHFLCWGIDLYTELSVEYEITLVDAIMAVPSFVFNAEIIAEDSSIIIGFFRDLLIGIILIGVGVTPFFKDLRNTKREIE